MCQIQTQNATKLTEQASLLASLPKERMFWELYIQQFVSYYHYESDMTDRKLFVRFFFFFIIWLLLCLSSITVSFMFHVINWTLGKMTKQREEASAVWLMWTGREWTVSSLPPSPRTCPRALAYPLHAIVVVTGVVGWEVEGRRGLSAGQGEVVLAV